MTEQNTLTTEYEKELQYCLDMAKAYSKSNDMSEDIHNRSLAKRIFIIAYNAGQKSIEEDRNTRARDIFDFAYELGISYQTHIENLDDEHQEKIRTAALSHGIDLSSKK